MKKEGFSIMKDKRKLGRLLRLSTAACMTVSLLCSVMPAAPTVSAAATTLTVGKSGTYSTISAAVSAAAALKPNSEANRVTISIEPGTYREQIIINTPYLSFVNSNPSGGDVLVTWYYGIGYKYYSSASTGYYNASDAASKSAKGIAQRWGTAVRIQSGGQYFRAENITFENSFNRYMTSEEIADGVEATGETLTVARTSGLDVKAKTATERAAAMCVEADYCEFYHCEFLSSQDTLYTASKAYFNECKIQGNTDYIFGSGDVVFDHCELCFAGYSDKGVGGYITAAREQTNGYLFWNCNVTANPSLTVASGYFGRPWRDTAHVLFYNTVLQYESIITSVGWTSMSGVDPSAATFREYNTKTASGGSVSTSGRTSGTVLSSCNVTRQTYLGSWVPYYLDYVEVIVPIDGVLIREMYVYDRENSGDWSIVASAADGIALYGDRDVTYIGLPTVLQGAEMIRTACDSKNYGDTLAEFTAAEDITLYVAMDVRVSSLPSWLSGWTKTDLSFTNSSDVTYLCYTKDFSAGETVTLGTNGQSSGCVNYTVFAVQAGSGVLPGDVSADGAVNLADLIALQKYLMSETNSVADWERGDMNSDGRLTATDFTLLKRLLLGVK